MPLEYKIINEKKLVHVTGWGIITFSELMSHMDELHSDPLYQKPMKKLIDYRQVDDIQLSMDETETFTQRKAEFSDSFAGEKCAIVAPKDVAYGTARVHDALIEIKEPDIETSVFRKMDEALEWLDIEIDD